MLFHKYIVGSKQKQRFKNEFELKNIRLFLGQQLLTRGYSSAVGALQYES